MLTRLSVENFKSWQKTGEARLAPITGLFGTNSSGKTSLLQLLLLLKQTADSPDRGQVLNFGDARSLVDLGDFASVIHGHDAQLPLKIGLGWTLPEPLTVSDVTRKSAAFVVGQSLAFSADIIAQKPTSNGALRLAVSRMEYQLEEAQFGMRSKGVTKVSYELFSKAEGFQFVRSQGRPWDLPAPVKCYGFPDQVRAYYQNAGFLSDFELEFEKEFARVYYLGPLRAYPQREYAWAGAQPADMGRSGDLSIHAILASRERGEMISLGKGKKRQTLEEYVAHWLKRLGLIAEFHVEPIAEGAKLFRVKLRKQPGGPEVLITDVGFGVSQILPVLVLCFYVPEGSTVVLEQPEIHLHPAVQAGLADVLIDAYQKRRIQVIVESHSEHLLRRLQRRVAEQTIEAGDIALYFCENDQGRSRLTPLELDMFGSINNWPEDFFGDEFGEMAAITRAAMERKKRETA
jgi:predicted ATPase